MSELAVAVLQFRPVDDEGANLEALDTMTRTAAARGARLVVAPEYASYFRRDFDAGWRDRAQPLDGPFTAALGALAGELGIHVVAGMSELVAGEDARFANTVVAIGADGVLGSYRKVHLYDAFGARESDWIAPGDPAQRPVIEVDGWRVGLQTCYDIRFPEVTRRLADGGAELIAVPAEWVAGPLKEAHWRTLVTARAIESTVYVAAADQAAGVAVGGSLIVDPMGVVLAALGEAPDVAVAVLDRARLDAVRERNPALRLRRYGVSETSPA